MRQPCIRAEQLRIMEQPWANRGQSTGRNKAPEEASKIEVVVGDETVASKGF